VPVPGLLASLTLIGTTIASVSPHAPASARPVVRPAARHRHGRPAAHPTASRASASALKVSAAKLLGQRIMVGMNGTYPNATLLRDVRAGRVGSVILFSANIVSRSQLSTLTGALQQAARAGGNPPLLIATDQEGGQVKRLPNGPPRRSPPQIAATGSSRVAYDEGLATGRYLKGLGVNWDLAPVLDVPTFSGAFIWRQGRAFSFSASEVATYGTQFAVGLQKGGAVACGKHFPGVGSAAIDTDFKLNQLRPTKAQRDAALIPYRSAIAHGLDTVMLSTAAFPAYDRSGTVTALSRQLVQVWLRQRLGFRGVTITDALGTPTGHDERTAGVLAARAGADVLLYTDAAPGELAALESDLSHGRLSRAEADASYARIVALKHRVAGP
jgi:beta-N-acetylhexosaminidase